MDVEQVSEAIAEVVGERMDALQLAQSQIAAAFLQADTRLKTLESRRPEEEAASLIERAEASFQKILDDFVAGCRLPKDGTNGKDGERGEKGADAPPADIKAISEDVRKALESSVMSAIEKMVEQAVMAAVSKIPTPKDGHDAQPVDKAALIKEVVALIPVPANGKDGADGKDGTKGADGHGVAGAMVDRDGALQITLGNGEVKNLGRVVGKDGSDGKDGKDGVSFETFELEYLAESHEIAVKATVGGRSKELRYPAGGIRPAGYWRENTKAAVGEAWVHDGSLWIAMKATTIKPQTKCDDWIIAARKGRDGETTVKTINLAPPAPIKLTA